MSEFDPIRSSGLPAAFPGLVAGFFPLSGAGSSSRLTTRPRTCTAGLNTTEMQAVLLRSAGVLV